MQLNALCHARGYSAGVGNNKITLKINLSLSAIVKVFHVTAVEIGWEHHLIAKIVKKVQETAVECRKTVKQQKGKNSTRMHSLRDLRHLESLLEMLTLIMA